MKVKNRYLSSLLYIFIFIGITTLVLYCYNQNFRISLGVTLIILCYLIGYNYLSKFIGSVLTKKIEKVTNYDELTGLPTLKRLKNEMEILLRENPNVSFGVIQFDIQNFKMINEMLGKSTGDRVLTTIASFSNKYSSNNPHSIICRLWNDNFIVIDRAENSKKLDDYPYMFEKHIEFLSDIYKEYNLRFRYGRYYIPSNSESVDTILENVNMAHSHSRDAKLNLTDYKENIKKKAILNTEITNRMDYAVANNEFHIHLQPKYNLLSNNIEGAEALVRWIKPSGNMIYPNDFIPLFEKNGYITKLDMYVYEKVCKLIRKHLNNSTPVVPISVNFSQLHLTKPDFVSKLVSIAEKYNIPTSYIEIELTETVICENTHIAERTLKELNSKGFKVSMDDFGAGYSSLNSLQNMIVDTIKIDRGFMDCIDTDDRGKTLLAGVFHIAKNLNLTTIAEGVETKSQIDFLKHVGCDMVQGYYFSKPLQVSEYTALIKKSYKPIPKYKESKSCNNPNLIHNKPLTS
ncbi:MAG: GGDEF domain-containing phosphodiesterase [Clostridium sp.]